MKQESADNSGAQPLRQCSATEHQPCCHGSTCSMSPGMRLLCWVVLCVVAFTLLIKPRPGSNAPHPLNKSEGSATKANLALHPNYEALHGAEVVWQKPSKGAKTGQVSVLAFSCTDTIVLPLKLHRPFAFSTCT